MAGDCSDLFACVIAVVELQEDYCLTTKNTGLHAGDEWGPTYSWDHTFDEHTFFDCAPRSTLLLLRY